MKYHFLLCSGALLGCGLLGPAQGVILFGLDNAANQTDPGTGVPFSGVAVVSYNDGSSPQGTAIHLGGGYMLTANHVGIRPHVSFDGSTYYARDLGFAPVQVASDVDMKIFRLTSTPPVASARVYGGSLEQTIPSTLIGWGVGRDPAIPVGSTSVTWGSNATVAKRWGVNTPLALQNIAFGTGSYEAILTFLGSSSGTPSGLGSSEAAATLLDSGSGLFQNIGGLWYLIGLTTTVETFGSSTFGNDQPLDPNGEANVFVRVSNHKAAISAIIPEARGIVLLGVSLLGLLIQRHRHWRFVR
jgi:hypothetical protein